MLCFTQSGRADSENARAPIGSQREGVPRPGGRGQEEVELWGSCELPLEHTHIPSMCNSEVMIEVWYFHWLETLTYLLFCSHSSLHSRSSVLISTWSLWTGPSWKPGTPTWTGSSPSWGGAVKRRWRPRQNQRPWRARKRSKRSQRRGQRAVGSLPGETRGYGSCLSAVWLPALSTRSSGPR